MKVLALGVKETMTEAMRVSKRARELFTQGAIYEAEKVMTVSQQWVPVDTGRLKNSKFINHNVTRDGVVSTLGYRAEYALPVHEIDRPHVVGRSQYLRGPLLNAMPDWRKNIEAFVAKAIG